MKSNYRMVKLACYATNSSMSVVSNLPPLLFLTFRPLYDISYSLLGAKAFDCVDHNKL